jgi:glycosyltransferase involved in cell wall biosynthesis
LKTIVVEAMSALQGGGQTYLLQLFQHIPGEWDGKYRIIAILPPGFSEKLPPGLPIEILTPEFPARSLVHRVLWYWVQLPRFLKRLKADVLFCPGGTLATRRLYGVKSVVTHQNMLPFDLVERKRYPYGYLRAKFWLLHLTQGASFRHADLVIFISRYAKSVIDRCIPQRRGRSVVIPHGLDDHFRQRAASAPAEIKGAEYVLYVSTLDFYKAQLEVVSAWARLRQRRTTHEKLLLVGPGNPTYGSRVRDLVHSLGLRDQVLFVGNVPYEELPAYYQNAKVNLFSSSCENCPNILLEAMAGGRPVLCSSYPPMPEFAGDAAVYFDPYSPDQLAVLLARFLDDEALRERMGAAALKYSQRYQWHDSARKTWSALAELAG